MARSSAQAFDPKAILNQGIVARAAPSRGRKRPVPEKTLLVTGLARSGTSMLAALLEAAGVVMGDHVYEPIHEDAEITQILRARDFTRLDAVIERLNARASIWGFKMPDLHYFLQHDEMTRFRNPHLLVILRDPVAVGVRNAMSEHMDGLEAIVEATSSMHSIAQFVRASGLPFVFLSYEKALVFPRVFIENLLDFCGIALDEAKRTELQRHVQPNRTQYVLTSKRTFAGHLEGVLEDGRLFGWARHVGHLEPVLLDVLIDDRLAATVQAGEFRGDLLAAGLGNGNHAFFLDLAEYTVSETSIIRVRINRRTFELQNSGMTLGALRALRAAR